MTELRHWLSASALAVALASASSARAQDSSTVLARRHFEAGVTALEVNDFQAARSSLEAAYKLTKCPEILVTIAEVEERRAALPAAIEALARYLELAPGGTLAETAQVRLEELESTLADQALRGSEVVVTAAEPARGKQSAAPEQAPSSTPPRSASLTAPASVFASPPAVQDRPSPFRLPAFIAFGVGGLSASGAIATGLIANGRYNDPSNCSTHCTDSHTLSSRTLAVTSGILAGVAAAGIGAGVVLLLTKPAHAERNRLVPALRLKLSAEKAAAGAVWRF
jgi:hypothetical protein